MLRCEEFLKFILYKDSILPYKKIFIRKGRGGAMFNLLAMLGMSIWIVEVFMLIFWGIYLLKRNLNIIDIARGLSYIVACSVYVILGNGDIWRKLFILILVSTWALRLTYYTLERFLPHQEDSRYGLIFNSEKKNFFSSIPTLTLKSLIYFMLQGILVVLLSIPFALISRDTFPYFGPFEIFGILVWMGGLAGEAIADRQLYQFKQDPFYRNYVCEEGLWRYSRHPNYFFEWVVWIGYCILALPAPLGWLGIIAPVLMFYLLFKVSIPLAESEALRTKGDAYQEYQKRTSVFFPWFRKGL